MRAVRIHSVSEPLENLLNPARPDGWVAEGDTAGQRGVSCCADIDDLINYANAWSMNIQASDLLVEVVGLPVLGARVDNGEVRIVVESYRVVGRALDMIDGTGARYAVRSDDDDDDDENE